jgi:ribosomal protein L11 methyltransferase
VLDLGTGSGVLAIAAAKVFDAPVLAGDIDPVAVGVARENCQINGVPSLVRTLTAIGTVHPEIMARRPFDLVMANILAGPLLKLAGPIRHVLAPRGAVILSGLLDNQAAEVLGRYQNSGFHYVRRYSIDGWSTLVLLRGADRRR